MSSNEIQGMIQIGHHVDELKMQLNAGVVSEENDLAIRAKAEHLINDLGFDAGQILIRVEGWREVNRVTTEYVEFDQNCKNLIDYLQARES